MTAIVEVRKLAKTSGAGETSVRALKSVDPDLNAGELLLLLGASGSGKATLISMPKSVKFLAAKMFA